MKAFIFYGLLFYIGLVKSTVVTYDDILALNASCSPKDLCRPSKSDRLTSDWSTRNCFCDNKCAIYNDCCLDAKTAPNVEDKATFNCVQMKQFNNIYIQKPSCPKDWTDTVVRDRCEAEVTDPRDLLTSLPVTSVSSGVTYRNVHCAVCNRNYDSHDIRIWQPRVECPGIYSENEIGEARRSFNDSFRFNETRQEWGMELKNGAWFECLVDPVLPETVSDIVRKCIPAIDTCHENWTDDTIASKCRSYMALQYVYRDLDTRGKAYRNVHCGMCNYEPADKLHCSQALTFRSGLFPDAEYAPDFNQFSFSVLLDYRNDYYDDVISCEDGEVFDPFFKKCRNVICSEGRVYVNGDCVRLHDNSTDNSNVTNGFPNCRLFMLDVEEYIIENSSVRVPVYTQVFLEGEYDIDNESRLVICADRIRSYSKFGPVLGYVTFICLSVSIICLTLHIIAFLLVKELRNLSGKNLVSLCVALLCAYVAFITGNMLEKPSDSCAVIGITTYYFFMATFFWMQAMAFDVWRTLRLATSELRITNGRQKLRFICYSLWAWGIPGIIATVALIFEYSGMEPIPYEYRPMFGKKICWFGQRLALIVFFAAPLAFTKISNISFFIDSARLIIATTRGPVKPIRSGPERRNFKLYVRMALIMGLTWAAGIVAAIFDIQAIWYIFVVLNTLQGLFIFLAFTCTQKVQRALKERFCRNRTLSKGQQRYASWSWSNGTSASADRSNQKTKLENHRDIVSTINSSSSQTFLTSVSAQM